MFKVNQKTLLLASVLSLGSLAAPERVNEPSVGFSPELSLARTLYRRHDYLLAKAALSSLNNEQALLIAAESSFRLGQWPQAKEYFLRLKAMSQDAVELKKIAVRLFEIELLNGDIKAALAQYESFESPPAIMSYSLGKAFFDQKNEPQAKEILGNIEEGSEFYLRARYMLAAMEVGEKETNKLLGLFKEIEDSPIISVEDHAVHDLAILAQGRILSDLAKEEQAMLAYQRVSTDSYYYPTATFELASLLARRSDQARLGLGPYQGASKSFRGEDAEKYLSQALAVIEGFRKNREVDWQNPELLGLMADLMVKAKRFDDAKVAYNNLFDHYQEIRDHVAKTDELWSGFDLDRPTPEGVLLEGVPTDLLSTKEAKELLQVKEKLRESEANLLELEQLFGDTKNEALQKAKALHQQLSNDFLSLALAKQQELSQKLLAKLDTRLAEPAFKRAQLILVQMRDIKKQLGVVREFQSKQIGAFESSLKAIDGGAQ